MREFTKRKKVIISFITLVVFVVGLVSIGKLNYQNKRVTRDMLLENLNQINNECNSVYDDVEVNERKYIELLKTEQDPFKIGMYSSTLVQVYTVFGDYDKIIYYSNNAIENYKKVPNGEYYAIFEAKYLAWSMLGIGRYSDSFRAANDLLQMTNEIDSNVLTDEESLDTEALIYSIFTFIYSQFDILDSAKFYYDKLCDLEVTPKLQASMGDRMAYSKMVYADKIDDVNLLKKYADQCYEISVSRDEAMGTNIADSVILNVGSANIKLGNLEEAYDQIKRAEEFFSNMNDQIGIGRCYVAYGDYYNELNDIDLVIANYDKALELYIASNDYYNTKFVTERLVYILKENNLEKNLDKYYKIFFDASGGVGGYKAVNNLLSELVNINDELNYSKLILFEKQVKVNKVGVVIASMVIVLLGILIKRLYSLIKKKNETEKRLEEIANTDYLTGVNTRAYGEKLIEKEIVKNKEFSMAIIDIDNFKCINDTYGHIFGDEILKTVAKTIKENIRQEDIIARYGGEEFIIAFIDKNKDEAKEILDRVRLVVSNLKFKNEVSVSFSGGIESWDNTDLALIISKADKLLYKAKNNGKNQVIIE